MPNAKAQAEPSCLYFLPPLTPRPKTLPLAPLVSAVSSHVSQGAVMMPACPRPVSGEQINDPRLPSRGLIT